MHLQEIKRALQTDCVASDLKTRTHVVGGVSTFVWTTRHQLVCDGSSKSMLTDLAAALWMYAGCPNKKTFSFLGGTTQGDQELRYGAYSDKFESSFNKDISKPGDVTIFRGNKDFVTLPVGDEYPVMELSFSMIDKKIIAVVSTTGGSVETLVHIVLPMVSLYLDELEIRQDIKINDNVLVNCKFIRERRSIIEVNDDWIDPTSGAPIYRNFEIDDCFLEEETMFADMTILDLNEVFENPTTIGGSSLVRRVLKPIVLGALVEQRGEETIDLVNQLPEGPTKRALLLRTE